MNLFNIGPMELILVLAIALLVFGPRRLPEIARDLGRALRDFRRASQELQEELEQGPEIAPEEPQGSAEVTDAPGEHENPRRSDPEECQDHV